MPTSLKTTAGIQTATPEGLGAIPEIQSCDWKNVLYLCVVSLSARRPGRVNVQYKEVDLIFKCTFLKNILYWSSVLMVLYRENGLSLSISTLVLAKQSILITSYFLLF